LKITIDELEFHSEYFYRLTDSIVEKIVFNNRTFYSKYEKIYTPLTAELLTEHQKNRLTLAVPLVEHDMVNYLVIEYHQEDWKSFYSLIKHLFKTLNIEKHYTYKHPEKDLLQIFIPKPHTPLELAYKEIERIKYTLELKSKKSYRIFPNKNSPKNYNIITLPLKIT
jgi:hypothetical protein